MPTIKKAQKGAPVKKKVVTDMQRDEMGKPVSPAQKKKQLSDELKMVDYKSKPAAKKKMKKGGSFPDLNKDGKVTKADILKGRGVIKNGGKMKKAKTGTSVKSAKKAMGGMSMTKLANMKKGGKCKYGCK